MTRRHEFDIGLSENEVSLGMIARCGDDKPIPSTTAISLGRGALKAGGAGSRWIEDGVAAALMALLAAAGLALLRNPHG